MKLYKSKHFIVWAATSLVLTALLTTATLVATQSSLRQGIESALGGRIAITKKGEGGKVFIPDFETKKEALKNGNEVVREICDEGMVLLKNENNALPLKANAKVSVFGKNSVNLVLGGSGSAAPKSDVPAKTIFDSLSEAGLEYNKTLKDFYENDDKSGRPRPETPGFDGNVSTLATGESDLSRYTSDVIASYDNYSDAAIVVFSRIAGENWDLPRKAADNDANEDRHYLQLDKNETALLKHICDSGKFGHVIVLINSSNNIDLGFLKFADDYAYQSKIDAALLIGSVGGNGIMALGDILTGKVNPSGHTVDTLYTHYENDPVWQNFGDNRVKDGNLFSRRASNGTGGYYFVDYEEGIYLGYRYYETRGYNDATWYDKNVVYPFGYGLSYTTFEEQLAETPSTSLEADKTFTVKVKVKNTGNVAGKDVVQLYATTPYTPGGIEKAYKVLVGFAKTDILKPGESKTVEIEVNPYDFASYDSKDKNGNGFKGYELEKGDYVFHVGKNAHEDAATFTKNLATGVTIDKDPTTKHKVENLFEQAKEHLGEELSRNDWTGSFPKTPTDADRTVSDDMYAKLENQKHDNPETFTELPTTGAEMTVKFRDLIGKPYNDELWDQYLDQMTGEEMLTLFNEGCYATTDKLLRLGVPKTISCDGPTGAVAFSGNPEVYGTCYYCSETIVAQTYNVKLAEKQGTAIGNECLLGDREARALGASNLPYSGWYAPGVNLHRSPFSGRNTEYYSEDPFISGKMAAGVIKAAQEKGVYANVKHFALNDQETNRGSNGLATFCEEQAIRELYLKPFEMAVKEGKTYGLMTSFNRIGTRWAGGYYDLITTVLRGEWGFEGSVICDYHTDSYMNNRQMIYAGGDLNLTINKMWDKKNVHF
ncbi:MAG: glycoside hydrolase family 3 C-terminal domain-containing protein, partial [Bacilli bacterium]|nr:glycoside hydrolase family 3 C-terminal domain-containing protein [Bacilli bacterium]